MASTGWTGDLNNFGAAAPSSQNYTRCETEYCIDSTSNYTNPTFAHYLTVKLFNLRRILKHSFSLLNVDHVQLGARWNYKDVMSPYFRLYYIDEGEGCITGAKSTCKLEPGYMYLVPSYTLCSLSCSSYLSQYFIHFFENIPDGISLFHHNRVPMKIKAGETDILQFKRLLQINPHRKINRSDNPKVYEKNIFYREYEELNNRQSDSIFLETQGIILQLIARFMGSSLFQHTDTSAIPSKVVDMIAFIQLHLAQKLTVAMLAKMANLHPDYFSRLFLQLTGERPLAYIHQRRIERAQYLMVTSGLSLAGVAEHTGFDSVPHLVKVFKKVTGVTPGQYRIQNHQMR